MDAILLAVGAGFALAAAVSGWWFRRRSSRVASAHLTPEGVQVAEVLVRGGYHPADIRVRVGRPVRLVFRRDENEPCSAQIFLAEPPLRRYLPAFATTEVTFTPEKTGTYLFTCEEGRHRGHLIVTPPARPRLRRHAARRREPDRGHGAQCSPSASRRGRRVLPSFRDAGFGAHS